MNAVNQFWMISEELTAYNLMKKHWSAIVRRKLHGNVLQFRKGKTKTATRGQVTGHTRIEYKLTDKLSYKPHYDYGQINGIGISLSAMVYSCIRG